MVPVSKIIAIASLLLYAPSLFSQAYTRFVETHIEDDDQVQIDSSAMLEISSNAQGFLPPTMTTTERDLIVNPAIGLVVFTIDDDCLNIYNGMLWYKRCCEPASSPISNIQVDVIGSSVIISFDGSQDSDFITIRLAGVNETFDVTRELQSPQIIDNLPPDLYSISIEYEDANCGAFQQEIGQFDVGASTVTGIGSFDEPGKDCNDIKNNNPAAVDGIYYIDPDGEGGRNPFICYCNVSESDEAWASIFYTPNPIEAFVPSECVFNFSNDDHDSYILWEDLSLRLAQTNTTSTSGQDWLTWTRDGQEDIISDFLPNRPEGLSSTAKPVPMPGMLSTAWVDDQNDIVIWQGLTFTFAALGLDNIGSLNTDRAYFITDGISNIHVGSFLDTDAVLLTFDYENLTITSRAVMNLQVGNTFITEQDAFGHVLWTVNGQPSHYFSSFNFVISGTLEDPNGTSGTIFNIPGINSSTQFGLDFFGRVDLQGNLWLVDWGHDNGGYFGCGNDSQLGTIKTNIVLTDFQIGRN